MEKIPKNLQFYKFSAYGFLKNLRFFEPFLILFFLEMGINYIQIGILYSIREELPTGIIADSFGRRKSMIFSFTSYIFSFIIFYFIPGFTSYIIAMIFFSIGEAFRTGTHKAMILSYLEIKKIKHLKIRFSSIIYYCYVPCISYRFLQNRVSCIHYSIYFRTVFNVFLSKIS
jgi:MFS family permease